VAETFAAIGDVSANVLHHLNNKVGTIPVRVQGIQDKCRSALMGDEYLSANLEEIERSAMEAMESVRQNLLHLHPIQVAPVDIASCVSSAVDSAMLPVGVEIVIRELGDLPPVVAGERSLTLVFTNLLENAADAMCGRGTITVSGGVVDDRVEIAVSDTGPGIPLELQERIFEFNFSGHGSSRINGLGFGLWWVRTLMVRLGGTVVVESSGAVGTSFRLRLPRAGKDP
jgi:signal transduction histidine kinase